MNKEIIEFSNGNKKDLQNVLEVTTKQFAEQLKTTPKVILSNAKKCLPNKKIEKGKVTHFTEEETTVILECLKGNNPNQSTFTGAVKVVNTELTPVLKIKNIVDSISTEEEENLLIQASMQLLNKKVNKIQSENKNLLEQNKDLRNDKDFLQQQSRIQNELLDIYRDKLDPRTDKHKYRAKYVYMQD
ncbi:MAG: hypothetical protein LBS34_00285 [Rickettsiales bacterium]|jgi:hypothetical protein|nr:hypothetical protein [Rickettsiales bacterium]